MDFSQFDQRGRAEAGVFVQLHDPYDQNKLIADDNGPCGFRIRGMAAQSVQQRLAAMQKKAKKGDKEEDEAAVMERIQQSQIETAMGYIIEPVNISLAGSLLQGAEGIRRILDMTFPDMRLVKDADGNQVTMRIKGVDGDWVDVPKFEMANETFATQVIKAAEDGSRFFGRTSTG